MWSERVLALTIATLALVWVVIRGEPAAALETIRVSVASDGTEGNLDSLSPVVSGNGRYVAFHSRANNLVSYDTNNEADVFVHDLLTGETILVSVSSAGDQGNDHSADPVLSYNGRFAAFWSFASNLVVGDSNGVTDVFVRDLASGITERVSVSTTGEQGNWWSGGTDGRLGISQDARFVSFSSDASNLVPNDAWNTRNIFVRDRLAKTTTLVSISSAGAYAGSSRYSSISGDGRYVAFSSHIPLVLDDTNHEHDIFVHDRVSHETTRVSVASDGAQANAYCGQPQISLDGRFITFWSDATTLGPDDTNGVEDVFVHDRQTSETLRASLATDGMQGNARSYTGNLSPNGRFVSFYTWSTNLVPSDTNAAQDVFLRDRVLGTTSRISVSSQGDQGNGESQVPWIVKAGGGILTAFQSSASDLVQDDINGVQDIFVTSWPIMFFDGFESGDTSAWSSSEP